ncbi:MAG: hypothetical protein GDA46_06135 [Bdellovibrionales bacterium]|nr:hypothetical protein [Bdellovibrionales bacterium]
MIIIKKIYTKIIDFSLWQSFLNRFFFVIQKYKNIIGSFVIAFFISDLFLIKSYSFIIPNKRLEPLKQSANNFNELKDKYSFLWETNIFHTGPIPSILQIKQENLEPVLSSLSFKLKGTIIHMNPRKSVATIQSDYTNKTLSYKEGERIENQAQIKKIEKSKLVFLNENNNRLEYILLPEENLNLGLSYKDEKKAPESKKSSLVLKKSENNYQVKRSDVNSYLMKLPEVLNQARVTPHQENGQFKGFRFDMIEEGSIFEELGFQKGDVIKEVDGEFIETPEQALQLFERLKGSSKLKILVEKEGQDVELEYNVQENAPIL